MHRPEDGPELRLIHQELNIDQASLDGVDDAGHFCVVGPEFAVLGGSKGGAGWIEGGAWWVEEWCEVDGRVVRCECVALGQGLEGIEGL